MNTNYSNDPTRIGQYFSDSHLLVTTDNLMQSVSPFESHQMIPPSVTPTKDDDIMTVKPRESVPEQFIQTGTRISKSCNMPGININRFENPHINVQNPTHIISGEDFRGGMPSRIVMKDNYVNNQK